MDILNRKKKTQPSAEEIADAEKAEKVYDAQNTPVSSDAAEQGAESVSTPKQPEISEEHKVILSLHRSFQESFGVLYGPDSFKGVRPDAELCNLLFAQLAEIKVLNAQIETLTSNLKAISKACELKIKEKKS